MTDRAPDGLRSAAERHSLCDSGSLSISRGLPHSGLTGPGNGNARMVSCSICNPKENKGLSKPRVKGEPEGPPATLPPLSVIL